MMFAGNCGVLNRALSALLLLFVCCYNFALAQPEEAKILKAGHYEPSYAPYYGLKKRIAVTGFDNKAGGISSKGDIGNAMAEMLTTELIKSGHFVVLERMALAEVIGEQGIGEKGIVTPESAAKAGKILGAQILVKGEVSDFSESVSGHSGTVAVGPLTFGGSSGYVLVTVDIRLIDATTGAVLQSHNASGKARSTDVNLGVTKKAIDFKTDSFNISPIGQATRQAIQEAVRFIIASMEKIPFSAKVAKIDGENIYINAGSDMNVKKGDKFQVYKASEPIIDPDTGLSLGSKNKQIGTFEVEDVEDKFAVGVAKSSAPLKPGDILKLE